MASEPERNNTAAKRSVTAHTIYERRAADAIRHLIRGPHADKLTARAFDCSVRMAQNLRAGKHWTIQRLTQASSILGTPFDTALLSDERHLSEMQEITERLARLESWREELRQPDGQSPADLSPARGEAADGIGGTGTAGAAGEPDRAGAAGAGQGHVLARTGR